MILGLREADDGEPVVTLKLTKRQADWVSAGMSDLLCWARGFSAALGQDDIERNPIGITELKEFRLLLLKEIEAAE